MKKSLYEIEEEYTALMLAIEDSEGELTPELEAELEINESQIQSKSIAYLSVIRDNEALISQIDAESKRLAAMKKRSNGLIDRLKGALLGAVTLHGDINAGLTKFSTRKSSSIEVDNVNHLEDKYIVTKVTESADKKALKEAIKSGEEIEGVRLKENLNLKIN